MFAQINAFYIRTRPWKLWSRLVSYLLFEGRPLTTRGRWINPFVFSLFNIAKRAPQLKRVEQPIFVLGMGRSGTTILGQVLSMHKSVGFLNEPKALWHSIHPGEDLIGSYSREPARYRLEADDATDDKVRHAHRLYGYYLAMTFSGRVVDKYPELIFRIPFLQEIFSDAKFVVIVRNGWDTCRSIIEWSKKYRKELNGEIHDWWGLNRRKWRYLVEQLVPENVDLAQHQAEIADFTRQSDMAAVEWIITMREGMKHLEKYPSHIFCVKFEELSHQPKRVLNELREFLDLSEDGVFQEYGNKILHPVKDSGPFDLHPLLKGPFAETMIKLGYA